jgi:hypothetical protein
MTARVRLVTDEYSISTQPASVPAICGNTSLERAEREVADRDRDGGVGDGQVTDHDRR